MSHSLYFDSVAESPAPADSEHPAPFSPCTEAGNLRHLPRAAKKACLQHATQRLSPALLHVVHQSTVKGRDRALAALIVLIYGPTPFGGTNNIKDVATRYGMTERNLYQLMDTLRSLLHSALPADELHE